MNKCYIKLLYVNQSVTKSVFFPRLKVKKLISMKGGRAFRELIIIHTSTVTGFT